jgi:hypothetical protein
MRDLVGLACLLALGASPLNVGAQDEGATSEPDVIQETPAQSEPAPEEPALQLQLDGAGVWIVTDWQTLEDMERTERRVRLAGRVGMPISATTLAVGAILFGSSYSCPGGWFEWDPPPCPPVRERNVGTRIAGSTLMAVGALGMIVSGALVGLRKRELRQLQQAHYGTRRRVQWDLAHRRLLF